MKSSFMTSNSDYYSQTFSSDDWEHLYFKKEDDLKQTLLDLFRHEKKIAEFLNQNAKNILSASNWKLLQRSNHKHESHADQLQRAYIGLGWQALFDEQNRKQLVQRCGIAFERFPEAQQSATEYASNTISKNNWYRLKDFDGDSDPASYLELAYSGCMWEFFYWKIEDKCRRIAQRRVPMDEVLADTLHDKTHIKLSSNHYKRVRNSYAGKGNPEAYLLTGYNSVFSDVIDSEYGKCRPPTWVKHLGKQWTEAFKWLCCKKSDIEEFVKVAWSKKLISSEESGEFIVKQLLAKIPSCQNMDAGQIPSAVSQNSSEQNDEIINNQQNKQMSDELQMLLKLLADLITNQKIADKQNSNEIFDQKLKNIKSSQWQAFRNAINREIDGQQLITLRLLFQEKLSVREAAEMLGVSQSKIIRYRQNALSSMRTAIEELGIFSKSELNELES